MPKQNPPAVPNENGSELNRRIVGCKRCPRLTSHCKKIAIEKRRAWKDFEYWGRPVPNMGTAPAPILIVGLAPGAHGANRTGRMFTGDRSGDWLFRAMYRAGLANQPDSVDATDGLQLKNCTITAVCHCAPPDNRPTTDEIANCQSHLDETWKLCQPRIIIALGKLAWDQTCRLPQISQYLKSPRPAFAHAAEVQLNDDLWLIGSYHPSQQNTFTGRLTELMLDNVFVRAMELAGLSKSVRTIRRKK